MKHLFLVFGILLCLTVGLAAYQRQSASVQLIWKFSGDTQTEADQKLARFLAPYVESAGFATGLCLTNPDGTCQKDAQGDVLYDLAKVSVKFEEVVRSRVDTAARTRFVSNEVDKARKKAEEDADKRDQPEKSAAQRPPS